MECWFKDTKMIKLSKPYIPSSSFELIEQVIQSGNLVQGEQVLAFENKLSKYLDIEHVIVVSSGTAALHLALLALGIKANDEVIVPAYSFPAVANAVEMTGASCCFVDISLDDYCMDTKQLESKINKNTKAIMPVHEFGQAADIVPIMALAEKYNLHVIEDAACAIGTKYNNQFIGTFGDMGCFSFHPRKILTTGEGGAITTRDKTLADRLRQLRNHGIQSTEGKIDFVLPGYNYRMTDFQASMGLSQLEEINTTINIHKEQASLYHKAFNQIQEIHIDSTFENRFQTYQTYHIIFESGQIRDFVKKELYQMGVESNIGAYSIPAQSYFHNKYNVSKLDYTYADIAYKRGLALPVGRHLNEKDIHFISTSVIKLVQDGL